jgi:hypothetical protein
MKKLICTLAGLMLLVSAIGQASAQTAVNVKGSDTLYDMTNYFLSHWPGECGGDDPASSTDNFVVYLGGGSGAGADAMASGTQYVAPMSSALKSTYCAGREATAEALNHSLDAISMYRSSNSVASADSTTCTAEKNCESAADNTKPVNYIRVYDLNGDGAVTCPGCTDENGDGVANEYKFADWKDVLALAYGGKHHETPTPTVNCNSDVRWALAGLSTTTALGGQEVEPLDCTNDCWEGFFMKDASVDCTDEKCNVNWHIWRRGDKSGTTDTFKSLTGITSFCNGTEIQDNDPVRRPVHAREDIPGRTDLAMPVSGVTNSCTGNNGATVSVVTGARTLGWLMPVVVPPTFANKNTNSCSKGAYGWMSVPFLLRPACEDGGASVFGQCLEPKDSTGQYGCVNFVGNANMFTPTGADTRASNMVQRNKLGVVVLDENGKEASYGYYNIHAAHVIPTYAVPTCNYENSSEQIACLSVASPCSVGFAGMGANNTVTASLDLELKGIRATAATVRNASYVMNRKLWLNSLVGFTAIPETEQSALGACFKDRAKVDEAAMATGFITLDDTHSGTVTVTDPCP